MNNGNYTINVAAMVDKAKTQQNLNSAKFTVDVIPNTKNLEQSINKITAQYDKSGKTLLFHTREYQVAIGKTVVETGKLNEKTNKYEITGRRVIINLKEQRKEIERIAKEEQKREKEQQKELQRIAKEKEKIAKEEQKIKDDFYNKNMSKSDFDIKKRELESEKFATLLKAQMESNLAVEKSQTIEQKKKLSLARERLSLEKQIGQATNLNVGKGYTTNDVISQIKKTTGIKSSTIVPAGSVWANGQQYDRFVQSIRTASNEWRTYEYNVNRATGSMHKMDKGIGSTNKALAMQGDTLGKVMTKFMKWVVMANLIYAPIRLMTQALETMKAVDTELSEIGKVLNKPISELKELRDSAYEVASAYGALAQNYLAAATTFARAGYEDKSKGLGELSTKAQIAGDLTEELASNFLLAVDAAYKYGGSINDLSEALDKANQLTNRNAVDMKDLTSGYTVAGTTLAQMGESYESTNALIGVGVAKTRRPGGEVGRGVKGIAMNLQQVKGVVDEESGEEITAEDISKSAAALDQAGISVLEYRDGLLELKEPSKILGELAGEWEDLNSTTQSALTSAIGGKYRGNIFVALMENWDDYEKMLQDQVGATGSAEEEVAIYLDSWEGRLNKLSNTWTEFVAKSVDSEWIKSLISGLTDVIVICDNLGNVLIVATGLWIAFNRELIVNTAINAASGIKKLIDTIKTLSATSLEAKAAAFGLTGAIGVLTVAVGIGAIAYSNYKRKQEEARQEAIETATAYLNEAVEVYNLKQKIEDLAKSNADEKSQRSQLIGIIQGVNEKYDVEAGKLKSVNDLRREAIGLIEAEAKAKAQEFLRTNGSVLKDTKQQMTKGHSVSEAIDEGGLVEKKFINQLKSAGISTYGSNAATYKEQLGKTLDYLNTKEYKSSDWYKRFSKDDMLWFDNSAKRYQKALENKYSKISSMVDEANSLYDQEKTAKSILDGTYEFVKPADNNVPPEISPFNYSNAGESSSDKTKEYDPLEAWDDIKRIFDHKVYLSEQLQVTYKEDTDAYKAEQEKQFKIHKELQDAAKKYAATLRAQGYNDDSESIQELQKVWWEAEQWKLDKKKEILEKQKKLEDDLRSQLKDAVNKHLEEEKDILDKQVKGLDAKISRYEALINLENSYNNLMKSVKSEQNDINTQLRISKESYPYLDEGTRKMLFNDADYEVLSKKLENIGNDAGDLYASYQKDINSLTKDNIYLMDELTQEFESQYEIKMKEYEVAKAELGIAKARTELENAKNERNTMMLIDGQFQWVADPAAVKEALENLSDAENDYAESLNDLSHQEIINRLEANKQEIQTDKERMNLEYENRVESWDQIQKSLEEPTKNISEILKTIAESDVPNLQTTIQNVSNALSELTNVSISSYSNTANKGTGGGNNSSSKYNATATTPGGATIAVNINSSGKTTTADLPKGTVVHTSNGDYKITGGNAGNYTSDNVSSTSRKNTKKSASSSSYYDQGGIAKGIGILLKGVEEEEGVIAPPMMKEILNPEKSNAFTAFTDNIKALMNYATSFSKMSTYDYQSSLNADKSLQSIAQTINSNNDSSKRFSINNMELKGHSAIELGNALGRALPLFRDFD
ncbi:MAG: phage tail tape measure protein [Aminipila sp.]